mmetsp:Transcript_103002/g.258339  ORF Transcript_103002/g.258339 Transcript_103002/m.258339 type:complete len:112 (+) Transcript_103002:633-968(+)
MALKPPPLDASPRGFRSERRALDSEAAKAKLDLASSSECIASAVRSVPAGVPPEVVLDPTSGIAARMLCESDSEGLDICATRRCEPLINDNAESSCIHLLHVCSVQGFATT